MKTQYLALSLILGACGQGAQNLADAINKASAANSSTSTATDTNTATAAKDPSKTPSNVASTTTTTDSTQTTTTTIHSSVTVTTVNGGAVGVSTNGQQGEGVQGTREPRSNSVNLSEDNLDKDGCTDWNLTGDFDVSIDIRRGADVKFVAYFDKTACNSADIDFSAGTAEGGVCDNNDEQYTLFHKNDLKGASQLMISRDKDHNLTYEALVRDEWVILESITLKKEWWGSVEFCVAR